MPHVSSCYSPCNWCALANQGRTPRNLRTVRSYFGLDLRSISDAGYRHLQAGIGRISTPHPTCCILKLRVAASEKASTRFLRCPDDGSAIDEACERILLC